MGISSASLAPDSTTDPDVAVKLHGSTFEYMERIEPVLFDDMLILGITIPETGYPSR
jgi:hypothetical protein